MSKDEHVITPCISIMLACKNREKNLPRILPGWHNIKYVKEIILLDYSSDKPISIDGFEKLTIVRVDGEDRFNLGKAYNLAFDCTTCDYVMKIDTDYELKDDSWFDIFFKNPDYKDYLLRVEWQFSDHLSGFFGVSRKNYAYFREDLNGWGYDEIDLHDRIRQNKNVKDIIWFDIEKYIYHIPHDDDCRSANYTQKDIVASEEENRIMCQTHSPYRPNRQKYYLRNDSIVYNKTKIDKIFCINLDSRPDRFKVLNGTEKVERFSAIDTRTDRHIYKKYGLDIKPCNISSAAYLSNNGAIGIYLSNYLIWKQIVRENISHALILEDDVHPDTVERILNCNVVLSNYELINLSKRITWDEQNHKHFFDGAESYIITPSAAQKLITATHFPTLLKNIVPQKFNCIDEDPANWNHHNAITCAVDKFIGYCCESQADESIRIKKFLYPLVDLCEDQSNNSNINEDSDVVTWEIKDRSKLLQLASEIYTKA